LLPRPLCYRFPVKRAQAQSFRFRRRLLHRRDDRDRCALYLGANSLFGPDIATGPNPLPGQTLDASDLDSLGGVTLATGTYGLGHVTFDVASGAATGPFAVTLTEPGSSLSDADGNLIPITLSGGTITIGAISSVPEPSSLGLVMIAVSGLWPCASVRCGGYSPEASLRGAQHPIT
jgi:hypothetical protein